MTNRNRAVIWVLAVFLLGAFSGGSIVYLLMPRNTAGDAQTERKRPTPDEMWKQLVKDLQLTPDQEPQVKQILDESRANTEKAVKALRADADDRMKKVLTADQFAAWQKLVQARRHHGKGPRP